jgi:ABC-2 type transport system permease protein
VAPIAPPAALRRGAGRWWSDYLSMLRWHMASLRVWLPLLIVLEVAAGVGFIFGISLFFKQIPPSSVLYAATGVPVINLLAVGVALGPQVVASQKVGGGYEYLRTAPVSNTTTAAAWFTVCLAGGVPAMIVSVLAAEARYGAHLQISWMIVPAVAMTSLAGTMLGYAIAHALSSPMATILVTQVLAFAVFGFTPVVFPISQMPRWLGTLNWWLPFRHMGEVMRAAMTTGTHPGVTGAYGVLSVWSLLCTGLALGALGRRG